MLLDDEDGPYLVYVNNGAAHYLDSDEWALENLGMRDRALLEALLALARYKVERKPS